MHRLPVSGYVLLFSLLLLTACGTVNPANEAREAIAPRLLSAYSEWEGTPYRLGGSSPDGIDCSAFVQVVMGRYLDVSMPRTTAEQLRTGRRISLDNLRSGDLVFFHTGPRTLHVGIIVRGDRFIHASTTQGVTVGRLTNDYWQDHYIQARRVL